MAEPKKEFTHKAQNLMRGGSPPSSDLALDEKGKPVRMQKNPKGDPARDKLRKGEGASPGHSERIP
jgi:hypothetical protein